MPANPMEEKLEDRASELGFNIQELRTCARKSPLSYVDYLSMRVLEEERMTGIREAQRTLTLEEAKQEAQNILEKYNNSTCARMDAKMLARFILDLEEPVIQTVEEHAGEVWMGVTSTHKHPKTPHRCPVCKGCGTVSPNFYNNSTNLLATGREKCNVCEGTGVLWA